MKVIPTIDVPSSNGLGFDWGGLLNRGVDITGNILQNTIGTPAGTYTRTGADGSTVTYRQPQGSTIPIFSAGDATSAIGGNLNANANSSGNLGTIILIGGGLLMFMLLSRR